MKQNAISEELQRNISLCIEKAIETRVGIKNENRVLVTEDVLFLVPLKLRENPIIKTVIKILESINVKLYISNKNAENYEKYWRSVNYGRSVNSGNSAIFYTNTNLMVRIDNIVPINGSSASLYFFTNDKQIELYYGYLTFGGDISLYNNSPEKELKNAEKLLYKYIHPHIYLDYYAYRENEPELNELIHATSLVETCKENQEIIEHFQNELIICNEEKEELTNKCDKLKREIYDLQMRHRKNTFHNIIVVLSI